MATKLVSGSSHIHLAELTNNSPTEAVLYVEQELTSTQKAQARDNIKTASASNVAYLGTPIASV